MHVRIKTVIWEVICVQNLVSVSWRLAVSDCVCLTSRVAGGDLALVRVRLQKPTGEKKGELRQCNSEEAYEAIFLCVSNDVCQPFSNSGFFLCLINVWR